MQLATPLMGRSRYGTPPLFAWASNDRRIGPTRGQETREASVQAGGVVDVNGDDAGPACYSDSRLVRLRGAAGAPTIRVELVKGLQQPSSSRLVSPLIYARER